MLAVTKKGPLFFTTASINDDRSKDDFADTARLICIAYQVPAAVMILESWMKMAAEGEKLDPDERPSEAIDRHEVVMVMGEGAGTTHEHRAVLGQCQTVRLESPSPNDQTAYDRQSDYCANQRPDSDERLQIQRHAEGLQGPSRL